MAVRDWFGGGGRGRFDVDHRGVGDGQLTREPATRRRVKIWRQCENIVKRVVHNIVAYIQFVNLGNPINRVPLSAFYHIRTRSETHFCDTSIFSITIKSCNFPIASNRKDS